MIVRQPFAALPVTWLTPLVAAAYIYLAVKVPDRRVKLFAVLVAIGPVSRMSLWLMRASSQTQIINAVFILWIDTAVYLGACIYVIYWFKTKVRYV